MKQFCFCYCKAIPLLLFITLCSCDSSTPSKKVLEQSQNVSYPEPSYNTNSNYSTTSVVADTVKRIEPVQQKETLESKFEEAKKIELPPSSKVSISKYYEEGYDKGYDDGEDDAVMENGWYEQFDDSNPYKGKKRKDYELGYEEGYEAGYYDNKDDDD